jgi:biotin carboxyl carrier protein
MPQEEIRLSERVRRLAEFLATSDAVRVRIERDGEEIELVRRLGAGHAASRAQAVAPLDATMPERNGVLDSTSHIVAADLEPIKADLVGIFRLGRPAPVEGELLDEDRELGYIEALGIRNPIHSLGGGRIVTIASADGSPVEYGQPLFLLDRG